MDDCEGRGRSKIGSALTSRELHPHRQNQLHLQKYIKRHPNTVKHTVLFNKNDQCLVLVYGI